MMFFSNQSRARAQHLSYSNRMKIFLVAALLACTEGLSSRFRTSDKLSPAGVTPKEKSVALNKIRLRLAELSLEDVRWRREADRVTVSIKPEGDIEAIRLLERIKNLWGAVVDEEEFRAEQIISFGGRGVRPMNAPPDARGPLGNTEERVVAFITDASLLPAAMQKLTSFVLQELNNTIQSEKFRVERKKQNMRPMDAPPSLIGRLEVFVDNVYREEKYRNQQHFSTRPIHLKAGYRGPLAKLEYATSSFLDVLIAYEKKRLDLLSQAGLLLKRPMEAHPNSPFGLLESIFVGLIRAPILLAALFSRIYDLLHESETDEYYVDSPLKQQREENNFSGPWWEDE
uniref:Uncharacterized protein n=1 Tax=Aureoumbra lagunensis TaxID=44058 RepID=A0A7S3NJ40_9STRA